jgi:hypothetical protein
MFAYPKQAEFNRVVPKNKVYAHAKVPKRVKELFVAQVEEIVWKYKLSPETINLPARRGINEIQVFEILLKRSDLDSSVLQSLDKAIPHPIMFNILHSDKIRFAASFKRPSEADPTKWVIEASFQTDLVPRSAKLAPLPVAVDLASLYDQLVLGHIPLRSRVGEGISDLVTRFKMIEAKKIAQSQLADRLAKEKQFNRRVELNASLRDITSELKELTH